MPHSTLIFGRFAAKFWALCLLKDNISQCLWQQGPGAVSQELFPASCYRCLDVQLFTWSLLIGLGSWHQMMLPVRAQVSCSTNSQRSSIPQRLGLRADFCFPIQRKSLSSGISPMMQQCSGLQGKLWKHHKYRDLWVMFWVLCWEVAVLSVGSRSSIQMLLEISSHCSTKKSQCYTESNIDPVWHQIFCKVLEKNWESWFFFFIAWKVYFGLKWCYFFSAEKFEKYHSWV